MATTNGPAVEPKPSVKEQRRQRRLAARKKREPKPDRLLVEFQPDAVELEHRSVPGGARWTLYTVILLLVGFVTWAYWAQVDRIVIAPGKLVTTETPLVIGPLATMEIESINVKFGDVVHAGDVLATLDPTFSEADVATLEQKLNALQASIARSKAEAAGREFDITGHESDKDWQMQWQFYQERQNEFEAKIREFASEREKLRVRKENSKVAIENQREQVEIFRDLEETSSKLLGRGSQSQLDFLGRKLQRADAETKLNELESTAKENEADLESLNKREAAFIASWRSELATGLLADHEKLIETEQELQKARRMRQSVELRVPEDLPFKDFIVLEIADLSAGSVIRAGDPLVRLMPMGAPLELEVEISGKDIGKVRAVDKIPPDDEWDSYDFPEGSRVAVKLNAFNYQIHGFLDGVVRTISEGAFEKNADQAQAGPSAATYRARIRLREPVKLENVPEDFRLMPGMTATAEIKVGKRRVLDYFLYPLLRYLDESIREP